MLISKEFKFEAAHKLKNSYTCKCQNIHGHSYKVVVTLKANSLNEEKVVVDYTLVKERIGYLFEALDHNCMVSLHDPITPSLIKAAHQGYTNLVVCGRNPTAEIIAIWLHNAISAVFGKTMEVKVAVHETASTSAEVCEGDSVLKGAQPAMVFHTAGKMADDVVGKLLNTPFTAVISQNYEGEETLQGFEDEDFED